MSAPPHTHVPKSSSQSSKRVQLYSTRHAEILQEERQWNSRVQRAPASSKAASITPPLKRTNNGKYGSKSRTSKRNAHMRAKKKQQRLDRSYVTWKPATNTTVKMEEIDSLLVFNGSSSGAPLESIPIELQERVTVLPVDKLTITKPGENGVKFVDDNDNVVATLIPRHLSLGFHSKCWCEKLYHALCKYEDKSPTVVRGHSNSIFAKSSNSSYSTIGYTPSMTKTRVHEKGKKFLDEDEREIIQRFVANVEQAVVAGTPTSETVALHDVKKKAGWEALANFYGAAGFGRNVYSAVHVEQVLIKSVFTLQTNKLYTANDDPVLAYMAFPRLGRAIGLRQGDTLGFNATEWHGVSSCVDDDEFMCITLFLQSAVVGRNNNKLPLTTTEKALST